MPQETIVLDGETLTIEKLIEITRHNKKIQISEKARARIQKARSIIEEKLKKDEIIYGVSTGFGKLANTVISSAEREKLQKNLIKSHSIGFGSYINDDIVLGAMVIELNSFCKGASGVREEIIVMLQELINNRVIPRIPSIGSLGASGDLSPLAYIARVLIGEGRAKYKGEILETPKILSRLNLSPITIKEKEGLSLTNGTHVLTSYAAHATYDALNILKNSALAVGLTLEAFQGNVKAFSSSIMNLRPHNGQKEFAKTLLKLLEGSDLFHKKALRVQDPYSLRCSPQVHGAILEAIKHCKKVIEIEINSTTDNPLIDIETNEVNSGGNFHGEPISLIMDYLAVALTDLGNVSERRVNLLLDSSLSNLPSFLISKPGLNSGLMLIQYADAAISAENKILANPASIDNTPVSANQEDHVSMGLTASKKTYQIAKNVSKMIGIEIYTACQALEFKEDRKISFSLQDVYELVRSKIKPLTEDRFFDTEVNWVINKVEDSSFIKLIEKTQKDVFGGFR
ncbi:MAG: histidine ammonia-lyase [Candidatus Heimdallarchaeaceae archaeon]